MIMSLCVSNFSILIFIYTSLSILKVLLTSLWLSLPLAAHSNSPGHTLLYCTSLSLGCATFSSFPFWHLHYLFLSQITPCPLLSFTWHPFSSHLLHFIYVTIISFVHHSSSNRHASFGTPLPQYSFTFFLNFVIGFLLHSCCTVTPLMGIKGNWSQNKSDNK